MQPLDHESKKMRFDPTINLGHVLTFIGFLLAGLGAWTTLDKRIVVLETHRSQQAQVDAHQDLRLAESIAQFREAVARLERQTERLADKLDKASSK